MHICLKENQQMNIQREKGTLKAKNLTLPGISRYLLQTKFRYSLERFKQNYVVQAPNWGRGVFHPRETHKE